MKNRLNEIDKEIKEAEGKLSLLKRKRANLINTHIVAADKKAKEFAETLKGKYLFLHHQYSTERRFYEVYDVRIWKREDEIIEYVPMARCVMVEFNKDHQIFNVQRYTTPMEGISAYSNAYCSENSPFKEITKEEYEMANNLYQHTLASFSNFSYKVQDIGKCLQ